MNTPTKAMPRTRKLSGYEQFAALSDVEKENVWKECDREIPLSETRPLIASERRQWERIKKKMGRPVKGKGSKVISLSVERELLEKADRYAKKNGMTRAALVAAGLHTVMKRPSQPKRRPAA